MDLNFCRAKHLWKKKHFICTYGSLHFPPSLLMLPLSLLLSYRRSRAIRDHKKKSTYLVCWEYFHKVFGIFTILMDFLQVTLGLFLIIASLILWTIWIGVSGCLPLSFMRQWSGSSTASGGERCRESRRWRWRWRRTEAVCAGARSLTAFSCIDHITSFVTIFVCVCNTLVM